MIDLHSDTIYALWKRGEGTLLENRLSVTKASLEQGGVTGQCFALFVAASEHLDESHRGMTPWEVASSLHDRFLLEIERSGIPMMRKADELEGDGLHAILTTEEGALLEGDLSRISTLRDWGVRIFSLTWNYENELAYPNSEDPLIMAKGLKEKGIEAIAECEEKGICIDVSHLNDGGFYDVARHSTKPFVATHSNSRSMTDVSRNLTDDMLRVLADHGGVAGLNFCPSFLISPGEEKESRISDMVRHVMHIYRVAGEDVLAIGTDFDGISGKLEIGHPSEIHLLREALAGAGLSESVLDKMWKGNALRVLRDTEV